MVLSHAGAMDEVLEVDPVRCQDSNPEGEQLTPRGLWGPGAPPLTQVPGLQHPLQHTPVTGSTSTWKHVRYRYGAVPTTDSIQTNVKQQDLEVSVGWYPF